MKRYLLSVVALVVGLIFAAAVADPKGLSKEEAESLIKGNTAEGSNVKWKKTMIWYFEPYGRIHKVDQFGNKGKARWSINAKGELCNQDKHMNEEDCAPIIPRADGGYDIPYQGAWKWDKIVPGNPHGL